MAVKICRRTGRIGYRSVGEARAAVRELIQREGTATARRYEGPQRETGAYRCVFCPRWHLTSQRQGVNGVNFDDLMGTR